MYNNRLGNNVTMYNADITEIYFLYFQKTLHNCRNTSQKIKFKVFFGYVSIVLCVFFYLF